MQKLLVYLIVQDNSKKLQYFFSHQNCVPSVQSLLFVIIQMFSNAFYSPKCQIQIEQKHWGHHTKVLSWDTVKINPTTERTKTLTKHLQVACLSQKINLKHWSKMVADLEYRKTSASWFVCQCQKGTSYLGQIVWKVEAWGFNSDVVLSGNSENSIDGRWSLPYRCGSCNWLNNHCPDRGSGGRAGGGCGLWAEDADGPCLGRGGGGGAARERAGDGFLSTEKLD